MGDTGPLRFFDRSLSWLEFNARVLYQASRQELPTAERLRFLGIVTDNFDDFCSVRLSALKRDGTKELLERVCDRLRALALSQARCLNREVLPLLREKGLAYAAPEEYSAEQVLCSPWYFFAKGYFTSEVFPLLTPLRMTAETISQISGKKLHVAFLLKPLSGAGSRALLSEDALLFAETMVAVVQIPANVPRVLRLPAAEGAAEKPFTLLDDIIAAFGTALFPGYTVAETLLFRLIRDADMSVDEDAEAFLWAMEDVLAARESSLPVCLWCAAGKTPDAREESSALRAYLQTLFGLEYPYVIETEGVMDPSTLQELGAGLSGALSRYEEETAARWQPSYPASLNRGEPLWDTLRDQDLLLHVPYESFEPVLAFIHDAARDPEVLAIKMTLYRTSGNPPIIDSLVHAAKNGKQVTVFVEIKARFDERRNLAWVERLERAGVIVIFGIKNLKVHAKILLVLRRGPGGLQRYVHFSTGNYNEKTARTYADLSIFTTDPGIAQDATFFFNMISGYSALETMQNIYIAPLNLKNRLISLIEREITAGAPSDSGGAPGGLVIAKVNSLTDEDLIEALYRAGNAGVRVLLNVRGVCMLVPGVPGLSDHITVRSIVGHYLEHERLFYFHNKGESEVYLSSADWMPRNMERRVELMLPVKQTDLVRRLKNVLDLYFADSADSWELGRDGGWTKVTPKNGDAPFSAQAALQDAAATGENQVAPEDFTVRRRT